MFHVKALDARGEWRDFAAKAEKQLEDGTYRNTLPGEVSTWKRITL